MMSNDIGRLVKINDKKTIQDRLPDPIALGSMGWCPRCVTWVYASMGMCKVCGCSTFAKVQKDLT